MVVVVVAEVYLVLVFLEREMSFWGFREREMGFIGRFQRSRRGVWEFLEF